MTGATTIFASATGDVRRGVGVFRISGPEARKAIETLCRPNALPEARYASVRKLHHPETGEWIDQALILWFPGPHSFTGEDVAEIHSHGGRAVSRAIADALRACPHFRMAEPGEFTRRAFENGRLDLTEAEAIADLVNAETEAQRRQALRQFGGELGRLYEEWRARLSHVLAYFEASIDFADEDLPADIVARQLSQIRALGTDIARHLDDRHRGERLREGFSIAILGPPNAGKSSLLNVLARRDAAIVSSTAGTTRDIIEIHLDLGGYPVLLADTAGLRESADVIENEGITRALARAEQADLKLVVFNGETWPQRDSATEKLIDADTLIVINKSDLIAAAGRAPGNHHFLSSKTGDGIASFLDALVDEIDLRFAETGTIPLTRTRHREALEECRTHLDRALSVTEAELRAEDVRLAMRALGRITGRVDVEDLLDIIFRDFCIGK